MKTYKVYFEIRGTSYREVEAENEEDAAAEVDHDMVYSDDCERANLESICVDQVEEVKDEKPKKKRKKK